MPGYDGSGPMGEGPKTGGGRGICNSANVSYNQPFANAFGMGLGRGFRGGNSPGMRRGGGRRLFRGAEVGSPTAQDELNVLKTQANSVKETLDAINRKISELEKTL